MNSATGVFLFIFLWPVLWGWRGYRRSGIRRRRGLNKRTVSFVCTFLGTTGEDGLRLHCRKLLFSDFLGCPWGAATTDDGYGLSWVVLLCLTSDVQVVVVVYTKESLLFPLVDMKHQLVVIYPSSSCCYCCCFGRLFGRVRLILWLNRYLLDPGQNKLRKTRRRIMK